MSADTRTGVIADLAVLDRILARCVEVERGYETPCWEWQGHRTRYGYGSVTHRGRHTRTHRVTFAVMVAEIPPELQIDHLCLNTSCVRPDHLEAVTDAENRRRRYALMTHCARGHSRALGRPRTDTGGVRCVECKRITNAEYERQRERRRHSP